MAPGLRSAVYLNNDSAERVSMNYRCLAVLILSVHLFTRTEAATPHHAGASPSAEKQSEELAADKSKEKSSWIDLVNSEGPQGFAKIGKNVTLCGDVQLKPDSKGLIAVPGKGVIGAMSKYAFGKANNLTTKQEFGDCELRLEFLIGKDSNSGIKLMRRYEIQLYDSHHRANPSARDCGGIYPHWVFREQGKGLKYIDEGVPPKVNAAKPAGEWQTLQIVFKAPRFDDQGQKTENAKFVSVILNDQQIHRDVEVDSPTGNASSPMPEVASSPLLLQLDHGAVAFRNVRIKRLEL